MGHAIVTVCKACSPGFSVKKAGLENFAPLAGDGRPAAVSSPTADTAEWHDGMALQQDDRRAACRMRGARPREGRISADGG